MSNDKAGVHLERLLALLDCFARATREKVTPSKVGLNDQREGIQLKCALGLRNGFLMPADHGEVDGVPVSDRKSTRLNSSHSQISYAVFGWKKKINAIYAIDSIDQQATGAEQLVFAPVG